MPEPLHELWGKAKEHPDYDKEQWVRLQDNIERAIHRMRERIIALMRRDLATNSRRAISWHEVEDCIARIHELPWEEPYRGQ